MRCGAPPDDTYQRYRSMPFSEGGSPMVRTGRRCARRFAGVLVALLAMTAPVAAGEDDSEVPSERLDCRYWTTTPAIPERQPTRQASTQEPPPPRDVLL